MEGSNPQNLGKSPDFSWRLDNIVKRYYTGDKIISYFDIGGRTMARESLKVLTESMFYVLLSLLRQERCGTEIVRYVDDATAGRVPLGPGTLYTILAKFQEEGLIREAAVEGRKRTYAITDRGRALFRQELSRLRLCVADGEREELASERLLPGMREEAP